MNDIYQYRDVVVKKLSLLRRGQAQPTSTYACPLLKREYIRCMFSLVLIDEINRFIFHPFHFTLHTVNTCTLSLMYDKELGERFIGTGGRGSNVLIGKCSTTFLPLRDIPRSLSFAEVKTPSVNLFILRDSSATHFRH